MLVSGTSLSSVELVRETVAGAAIRMHFLDFGWAKSEGRNAVADATSPLG